MTNDRDKLIELICDKIQDNDCVAHCNHPPCNHCETVADHLIEHGVTIQPCRVGDEIYVVDFDNETIYTMEVQSITIEEDGISLTIWNDKDMHSWDCFVDEMEENNAYFNPEKAKEVLSLKKRSNN